MVVVYSRFGRARVYLWIFPFICYYYNLCHFELPISVGLLYGRFLSFFVLLMASEVIVYSYS